MQTKPELGRQWGTCPHGRRHTSDVNADVAFVLSGGGSLGAVQVGMLQALYERGVKPDVVAGTSVGAVNGAFIASRPQVVDTVLELASVWRGLTRSEVFPVRPLKGLMGFVGRSTSLVSPQAFRDIVVGNAVCRRLEDTAVPFHVIATDLLTGMETRLSKGDLVEAVLASAAIPGIFPPIEWEGRLLVDGGVSNNTPVSHCRTLGAKTIYVLPTGNACALRRPPRSAMGVVLHSMSLLVMQRLILEIDYHREDSQLIVLPPPCPLDVQPIDFSRADELIRRGRQDAMEYLDDLDAGRASAPIRMSMHRH